MADKFLLIELGDERSKKISQVLGNKTCKKIINLLSETKEASEKDISDNLKIPMNTVEYNLKKLLEAGLIEKTKNFFWSKKGRKIDMYKISNKSIVISPKSKKISRELKSILPALVLSGVGALVIRQYFMFKEHVTKATDNVMFSATQAGSEMASRIPEGTLLDMQVSNFWLWFLGGAIFSLLIISILKLTNERR